MTSAPQRERLRGRGAVASTLATTSALLGCILASLHLILGGTSALALSRVNPLVAWPYFIGVTLVALELRMHASQPPALRAHIVITVGAGLLGFLSVPVAWLYFGLAGIGADSQEHVFGILAAFSAAVVPVLTAFTGGVISWRTVEKSRDHRLRATALLTLVAAAVSVGCILFARLSLPGPL